MSRWETALVSGLIGAATPFTLMVMGWWGSASLLMAGLVRVTDAQIAVAAGVGLAVGLLLDLVFLRGWVAAFYRVDLRPLIPLYLFWTVMATAFFMGLPPGNLLLGSAAGAYSGRRAVHEQLPSVSARRLVARMCLFTACVTSAAALGIGLLAAREPYTLAQFRRLLGVDQSAATLTADLAIVAMAVVLLAGIQFWLTRLAAAIAMGLAPNR